MKKKLYPIYIAVLLACIITGSVFAKEIDLSKPGYPGCEELRDKCLEMMMNPEAEYDGSCSGDYYTKCIQNYVEESVIYGQLDSSSMYSLLQQYLEEIEYGPDGEQRIIQPTPVAPPQKIKLPDVDPNLQYLADMFGVSVDLLKLLVDAGFDIKTLANHLGVNYYEGSIPGQANKNGEITLKRGSIVSKKCLDTNCSKMRIVIQWPDGCREMTGMEGCTMAIVHRGWILTKQPTTPPFYMMIDGEKWYFAEDCSMNSSSACKWSPDELEDPYKDKPKEEVGIIWESPVLMAIRSDGKPVSYFSETGPAYGLNVQVTQDETGIMVLHATRGFSWVVTTDPSKAYNGDFVTILGVKYYLAEKDPTEGMMDYDHITTFKELTEYTFQEGTIGEPPLVREPVVKDPEEPISKNPDRDNIIGTSVTLPDIPASQPGAASLSQAPYEMNKFLNETGETYVSATYQTGRVLDTKGNPVKDANGNDVYAYIVSAEALHNPPSSDPFNSSIALYSSHQQYVIFSDGSLNGIQSAGYISSDGTELTTTRIENGQPVNFDFKIEGVTSESLIHGNEAEIAWITEDQIVAPRPEKGYDDGPRNRWDTANPSAAQDDTDSQTYKKPLPGDENITGSDTWKSDPDNLENFPTVADQPQKNNYEENPVSKYDNTGVTDNLENFPTVADQAPKNNYEEDPDSKITINIISN